MIVQSTRYSKSVVVLSVAIVFFITLHHLERTQSSVSKNIKQYKEFYLEFSNSYLPRLQPPEDCEDPYRSPGYLYSPYPEDNANLAWINYAAVDLYSMPSPETAQHPPARADLGPSFDGFPPPEELRQLSPTNWITEIRRWKQSIGTAAEDDSKVSWMRGKRVLLLSDSVDRFMTQYFCKAVGHPLDMPSQHTTASCNVPELNFTIFHWHISSMCTARPAPWYYTHLPDIDFEKRIENIFRPTLPRVTAHYNTAYPNNTSFPDDDEDDGVSVPSPSLVLFQSVLWDAIGFTVGAQAAPTAHNGNNREVGRSLSWSEVHFYSSRLRKLIRSVRKLFGENVPLMYRAYHGRNVTDRWDLKCYDMDNVSRYLCKEMDVEVFEWGRMVRGHTTEFQDDFHVGDGPLSWLWGNMVLSYLFRAEGGVEVNGKIKSFPGDEKTRNWEDDAWGRCHAYQMGRTVW